MDKQTKKPEKKSINRNIASSITFSLLARGFSFFQSVAVSWQYGAGRSTDIFYFTIAFIASCTAICTTINRHVVVPNYIRLRDGNSEDQAMRFANFVFAVYISLGTLAVAVMMAFPVRIFSGLSQFGTDTLILHRPVLSFTIPTLLLFAVNSLITDLFTAYKHFTMPMVVDMLKSVLVIALTLLPWTRGSVVHLAQTMLAAHVVQFLFLAVAMNKVLQWKPVLGKVPMEKKVGSNVAYVIVGQVVAFFAEMVIMHLISGFDGGVYTSMEYALKVNTVVATVVISQFTTIVGIQIIEHYNAGEFDKLNSVFGNYMRAGFFVIAPACFALSLCANPLMSLLFERGRFGAEAVQTTAQFFSVFILIIPFTLLGEFVNRLVIAQQMQHLSVIWKIVLNALIMALLFFFVRGFGFLGAPLGQFAGYVLYTVFLFAVMRKHFPYIQNEKGLVVFLLKCLVLNVTLLFGFRYLLGGLLAAGSTSGKITAIAVSGLVYILAYIGISCIPGVFLSEIKQVLGGLRQKRSSQKQAID